MEGWLDIRINARHKIRSSSSKAVQYHNRSEEGWKLEGILYSEEGWELEGILYSEVADRTCRCMLNIFFCI